MGSQVVSFALVLGMTLRKKIKKPLDRTGIQVPIRNQTHTHMEQKIILNEAQVADILRGNSVSLTQEQRDGVIESVGKMAKKAKRWIRRYIDGSTTEVSGEVELGISPSAVDKEGNECGKRVAYRFNKGDGSLTVYAPEFIEKFADELGVEVVNSMLVREYGAEFEFKASKVTTATLAPVNVEEEA